MTPQGTLVSYVHEQVDLHGPWVVPAHDDIVLENKRVLSYQEDEREMQASENADFKAYMSQFHILK